MFLRQLYCFQRREKFKWKPWNGNTGRRIEPLLNQKRYVTMHKYSPTYTAPKLDTPSPHALSTCSSWRASEARQPKHFLKRRKIVKRIYKLSCSKTVSVPISILTEAKYGRIASVSTRTPSPGNSFTRTSPSDST